MKSTLLLALLTTASLCLHAAPKDKDKLLPLPKEKEGRWGVYSFDEAKKEAVKKKQFIAFIVTDDRAEEASVKEAALTAFWNLEKDATMVILPGTTAAAWKERLPAPAYAALTDKATAKEFPRVVVMDQNAAAVIGSMPAGQIIDGGEKAVKEFSKSMKETNKDPAKVAAATAATPAAPEKPATAAPATAATTPAGPFVIKDGKPENWTNAQGRTIQATLLEVNGDQATLLLATGAKAEIAVSTLAPDSQKRVEELKAASAK